MEMIRALNSSRFGLRPLAKLRARTYLEMTRSAASEASKSRRCAVLFLRFALCFAVCEQVPVGDDGAAAGVDLI